MAESLFSCFAYSRGIPAFAQAASLSLLADPTLLEFGGKRWLLSHGDALCLDDTDYQHFRAEVRSAAWQQAFLAQPLADRKAMARSLREQSQARQRSALHYADLHHGATLDWLAQHRASVLIHGHTHRPAEHTHEVDGAPARRRRGARCGGRATGR